MFIHKWNEPYMPLLPSCRASPHLGRYSFSIPLRAEGWVVLSGWSMRRCTHPQLVTHPSTKRARHRVTSLININALPLSQAATSVCSLIMFTSSYVTMLHGRRCNPHRSTTTFANLEITSLWRHWWRHNSETIRDGEKRRPPRAMKSSELFNGENRIALRQLLQNRKLRHWW